MRKEEEDASFAPSCPFLGPLEAAEQPALEAFYLEARDSYYSGQPLILDEMFDQVELRLRRFRSRVVQKYPRCSLRRHTTYADAEEDPGQTSALCATWATLFALGSGLTVGAPLCTAVNVWSQLTSEDARLGIAPLPSPLLSSFWLLACFACSCLGFALASAAFASLQRLASGTVVALKGACPSCAEDVYAFVKVELPLQARAKEHADCHVCGQHLVFQAYPEETTSGKPSGKGGAPRAFQEEHEGGLVVGPSRGSSMRGTPWVYGRVYAVSDTDGYSSG